MSSIVAASLCLIKMQSIEHFIRFEYRQYLPPAFIIFITKSNGYFALSAAEVSQCLVARVTVFQQSYEAYFILTFYSEAPNLSLSESIDTSYYSRNTPAQNICHTERCCRFRDPIVHADNLSGEILCRHTVTPTGTVDFLISTVRIDARNESCAALARHAITDEEIHQESSWRISTKPWQPRQTSS